MIKVIQSSVLTNNDDKLMELFNAQMRLTAGEDAVLFGAMQQRRNTVEGHSLHEEKSQEMPLTCLHMSHQNFT